MTWILMNLRGKGSRGLQFTSNISTETVTTSITTTINNNNKYNCGRMLIGQSWWRSLCDFFSLTAGHTVWLSNHINGQGLLQSVYTPCCLLALFSIYSFIFIFSCAGLRCHPSVTLLNLHKKSCEVEIIFSIYTDENWNSESLNDLLDVIVSEPLQ